MEGQVTVVVRTIMNVLEKNDIEYVLGGDVNVKDVLTKPLKDEVKRLVLIGFNEGKINMTDKAKENNNTEKLMIKYVNGLVDNWVRKYKPFNQGIGYKTKNPGSRSGDEQVKEMKKLLKTYANDPETVEKIQLAIDARLLEIKPAAEEINVDALPEALRNLV